MFEQKIDRDDHKRKKQHHKCRRICTGGFGKIARVTVSRQSNSIALNGKNGVAIMINGKISYMPQMP
jgi:hypothetical protein